MDGRSISRDSHTCHFKQVGLKDGLPAAASFSVVNTYRLGMFVDVGPRGGKGLGA